MLTYRVSIDTYQFDFALYSKTLKEAMRVLMRVAARAFVRAAILAVPVQTGMARGSYLNIGRFLRVAIPINPTLFNKYYYSNGIQLPKTPDTGALLSIDPQNILTDDGRIFSFQFGTDVKHYNINEFFPRVPSAPWGSMEAGKTEFFRVLSQELPKRFPNLNQFLVKTTITGGPEGVKKTTTRVAPVQSIIEDF